MLRRATLHNCFRISPKPFCVRLSRMPLITISQSLDQSYTKHGVIPDVVDKFDTQGLLTIEYPKGLQVSLGNELKVAETQEVPQIQYTPNLSHEDGETEAIAKEDKFILVLTDPDAPSRTDKKWSEYAHWLVSDLSIKSNDDGVSYKIDPSEGKALLPYVGPAPPKDTGHHRYVFLLYKQDPLASALPAPADRPNWGTGVPSSGVRDWIAKNAPHLKPLAVNFFRAENAENEH